MIRLRNDSDEVIGKSGVTFVPFKEMWHSLEEGDSDAAKLEELLASETEMGEPISVGKIEHGGGMRDVALTLVAPVSTVKCHFSTIMTIIMRQCEDRCHNSMH